LDGGQDVAASEAPLASLPIAPMCAVWMRPTLKKSNRVANEKAIQFGPNPPRDPI
jgi:hypothetical protein